MKLPNFRRIMDTDYHEDNKSLVRKLAVSINYGIEVLYQALNKRLTLNDNIQCTVRTIQVKVDDNGIPLVDVNMPLEIENIPVIGVTVMNPINNDNVNLLPNSAVQVFYERNSNTLKILKVTGIQSNTNYSLTLVAWN